MLRTIAKITVDVVLALHAAATVHVLALVDVAARVAPVGAIPARRTAEARPANALAGAARTDLSHAIARGKAVCAATVLTAPRPALEARARVVPSLIDADTAFSARIVCAFVLIVATTRPVGGVPHNGPIPPLIAVALALARRGCVLSNRVTRRSLARLVQSDAQPAVRALALEAIEAIQTLRIATALPTLTLVDLRTELFERVSG